jgi:hypothetical protein
MKEKESREQSHRQQYPPSSLQSQIKRPMEENIGAALHPTITGESDIQLYISKKGANHSS